MRELNHSIEMLPRLVQTPSIRGMPKNYRVTKSIDNQEQNRCVDIIQDLNGGFRFQEWRREPEDISGWFLMLDSSPKTFVSETDAISVAKQTVIWFNDLNT